MPDKCPCGSRRGYLECCGRYIEGGALPPSAEALMRSRYSAYTLRKSGYIVETSLQREDLSSLEEHMRFIHYFRLEIVETRRGSALDRKGTVEFRAYYEEGKKRGVLYERSAFLKRKGRWYYDPKNSLILSQDPRKIGHSRDG